MPVKSKTLSGCLSVTIMIDATTRGSLDADIVSTRKYCLSMFGKAFTQPQPLSPILPNPPYHTMLGRPVRSPGARMVRYFFSASGRTLGHHISTY